MSRLAKKPIQVPAGTEVKIEKGKVTVKGSKGELFQEHPHDITVRQEDGNLFVALDENGKTKFPFLGLYCALIGNMVEGVSKGFEKRLNLIGVGYRAAVNGNSLDVQVGYSHPTARNIPEGLEVVVEKNTTIVIKGADKRLVGQFAADIRSIRPPEPYKGKGIRYEGEYVRKKAGKTAKGG